MIDEQRTWRSRGGGRLCAVADRPAAADARDLGTVLFQLRLDGLRVLIGDPDAYPLWMLAQGFLFVTLRELQPAPATTVLALAHDAGLPASAIDGAVRALGVRSFVARERGQATTFLSLPAGLRHAGDLVARDRRWLRYCWS